MRTRRNLVTLIALVALLAAPSWGQSVRGPTITGAVLTATYTAGTVLNGGHAVTIAAGTSVSLANQNDCTSPVFAACNFLYANSAGAVATTQTLATASAAGNVLLALIETGAAAITRIAYPNQSGTVYSQALGPMTSYASAPLPAAAAGVAVGSALLPFESIYLGTAATNNIRIDPLATAAARAIRLADQGAAGAIAVADPVDTTKVLNIDLAGQTGGTTLTLTSATTANRAITLADPGGAATLAYINSTVVQPMASLGAVTPFAAATYDLGAVLLPWDNLYIGTAATNNFVITPAATAAARIITLVDPLGAANLAYTNPAAGLNQALTNTSVAQISAATYSSFSTYPITVGAAYTDTADINGRQWFSSIFIPTSVTLTGACLKLGTAPAADNWIAAIWNSLGATVATSNLAGVLINAGGEGAQNFQCQAFTAPVAVTGPARYFVGIQGNGADANAFYTYAANTVPAGYATGITAPGVFGTITAIVPTAAFTADQGPVMTVY